MRNLILTAGVAMLLAYAAAVARQPQQTPTSRTDATHAAADFELRVQNYVKLHRALEGTLPAVAVSDDYAEVLAAIDALASELCLARKDARPGDIFTPEIECWFREMVAKSLEGSDPRELLSALNEENEPNVVMLALVNGRWPEGASRGPMPPKLLADLPPLPDELRDQFLDGDLVLLDVHADLIVDFIKRVLP
jgi:hypothetical protein